ncbi:MAG TPA: deoxyribose-phosphate aldolase [Spirochaeta sp.]|nr:deoxyribose-phosphate aldolase [Spirochaeta sp.]
MELSVREISRLIDISAVKAAATKSEVLEVAELSKKYNFICAFAMPCFTEYLVELLADYKSTSIGGAVGFPSGADTTKIKSEATRELIDIGCNEIDMVINVGALKSGDYDLVSRDIEAVVKCAGNTPVKSILEIAYLTDEEIIKGAKLAVDAGDAFVKTGTGWAGKPTTVETIKLIKEAIGDQALVKAAGGVRTLEDLEAMYDEGCSRFGIGAASAIKILEAAHKREGRDFGE